MSPADYAYMGAILLAAYFIRGISGFGSGLVSVPLLALKLPLTFVVPLILLTDFSTSLVLGGLNFRQVAWTEIRRLFLPGLIGVAAGTLLLVSLPKTPMLIGLGTFVILFAVRTLLFAGRTPRPAATWWAWPAALTGGTVGALFGTGGPPYVIYLSHRLFDKGQLRATFSGLFFIEGLARIVSFTLSGLLLDGRLFWAYLAAMPIALAALWLGSHVHTRLSNRQMMQVISLILLGSGASLYIKALA
ncbi:sulfite exporter TauE/SafE family protein [Parasulfuritortus cantonensis]|uniref:Probable membrane transporter protein n=1 Tax=Parasulfuritortus cantonensis TaxID=2528202 RepID=A0A4R1BGH5_9PROT|nr:sulfite exporter TauE/SafE family protein [Parasulfuritortus cantonensis]TCJ16257.1 sulfite exporter TauE/SafE family protein [Parasulfuritortus cantonensis]